MYITLAPRGRLLQIFIPSQPAIEWIQESSAVPSRGWSLRVIAVDGPKLQPSEGWPRTLAVERPEVRIRSNGRVTMLVLVISFASFFLFLIMFLCAKRSNLPLPRMYISPGSELHPTFQFQGPLVSVRRSSRPGSQLPHEPEEWAWPHSSNTNCLDQSAIFTPLQSIPFLPLMEELENGSSMLAGKGIAIVWWLEFGKRVGSDPVSWSPIYRLCTVRSQPMGGKLYVTKLSIQFLIYRICSLSVLRKPKWLFRLFSDNNLQSIPNCGTAVSSFFLFTFPQPSLLLMHTYNYIFRGFPSVQKYLVGTRDWKRSYMIIEKRIHYRGDLHGCTCYTVPEGASSLLRSSASSYVVMSLCVLCSQLVVRE